MNGKELVKIIITDHAAWFNAHKSVRGAHQMVGSPDKREKKNEEKACGEKVWERYQPPWPLPP